jgi:hypothetical protein
MDRETELVRFGARDYEPRAGRWTAKDPVGIPAGPNSYAFCFSRALDFVDADGMQPRKPHGPDMRPDRIYKDLQRTRDKYRARARRLPGDNRVAKNIWEHASFSYEIACRYGNVFTLLVNTAKEYEDWLFDGQSFDDGIRDLQSDQEGMDGEIPEFPVRPVRFGGPNDVRWRK